MLDAETAGNLSYSLSRAKVDDVSRFFRFVETEMEANDNNNKLIRDWGISQTSNRSLHEFDEVC